MANTKFDSRQTELRSAQAMIGSAANDTLDSLFPKINDQIAKLYEDRNITLTGGGSITNTGGTSLSFTSNFILHINSNIAGAAPYSVSIGSSPWSFSADGRMAYITITSRSAGTFALTTDASSLPAVNSSNQEVFLIAKRVGTDIYFRNGFKLVAGQSGDLSQNFSFLDSNFVINDASDPTKQIAFDASGSASTKTTITSSQTANRTLTLPDTTDTLVAKNTTDFLTNKSVAYTSSSDSSTTGSNASLSSFTTGIVRLTNASLASVSGIPAGSSGQSLIVENKTGNTIVINNEETTPAAANRIQTGVNKNVSMQNNASFVFTYDSTSARWQLTGGSGSGGLNVWTTATVYAASDVVFYGKYIYICVTAHTSAAAFETDLSATKWRLLGEYQLNYLSDTDGSNIGKWSTYADAAGTTPVDGTGGSPNSTFAVSSSTNLRGITDFLFTKNSGASRQGEGFSYDFSIDPADKAKVLQLSFEYLVTSADGTYVDNDLSIWVYDVTNSQLIACAPTYIKNSRIIERYNTEFQTASNSTSYRLIFHISGTTNSTATIRFTNFLLGPQAKLYGSPITDVTTYTPVAANVGTATFSTLTGRWRRVGDKAEIVIVAIANAAGSGASGITFSLPSGLVGDADKYVSGLTIGEATHYSLEAATQYDTSGVGMASTTTIAITNNGAGGNFTGADIRSDTQIYIKATIPIVGWGSSLVLSSDADTRVVAATAVRTSSNLTINTSATDVVFNSASADTHAAMNTSTGVYTIPVSGWYEFDSNIRIDTGGSAPTQFVFEYVVNGSGTIVGAPTDLVASKSYYFNPTHQTFFNAGTTVKLRITSATNASTLIADQSYLYAKRIAGPSQIMASETVAALYTGAPPTGTLTSSFNTTTFGTKVKDSHGAYSSGSYTIPTSGTYAISAQVRVDATWVSGNSTQLSVFIDGTEKYTNTIRGWSSVSQVMDCPVVVQSVPLLAGQVITIRTLTTGSSPTFGTGARNNYFSITRTGNY